MVLFINTEIAHLDLRVDYHFVFVAPSLPFPPQLCSHPAVPFTPNDYYPVPALE